MIRWSDAQERCGNSFVHPSVLSWRTVQCSNRKEAIIICEDHERNFRKIIETMLLHKKDDVDSILLP
jgi:hypothetical protein